VTALGCIAFLQWVLPQLGLCWPGFRKVRGQVCKRVRERMRDLGLDNFAAYRARRLEADPTEWRVLDECCHITISRFFRDRAVFEALRTRILPDIAERAERERRRAQVWSAGCASGEEPYTIRILWDVEINNTHPAVSLSIIATDVDDAMLERALRGCYKSMSLHELPVPLIEQAFERRGSVYCVKSAHRRDVEFLDQDIRSQMPPQLFDLILCRYVALTYFATTLRRKVITDLLQRLRPSGYFVIGAHERLPEDFSDLVGVAGLSQIFQKKPAPSPQQAPD
jgi:chemotaxis protein methyltransferase CheR